MLWNVGKYFWGELRLSDSSGPHITVVLTTRNRPDFLHMALRYYREQTYSVRDLVVVDDSDSPSREPSLCDPDVLYIYLKHVLPLGSKLNLGIECSRGEFILKMDDDDYYAPDFLLKMFKESANRNPLTSISFLQPFLFLGLHDLQIRHADPNRCSGATFFFHRKYWNYHPFRNLPEQVDAYFLLDHGARKEDFNRVNALESFLQVRHTKHLWNRLPDGEQFDTYFDRQKFYQKCLSSIVPGWAYDDYSRLSKKLYGVERFREGLSPVP
jgi:glycosyltransferase involved in cell wall biosynthesis